MAKTRRSVMWGPVGKTLTVAVFVVLAGQAIAAAGFDDVPAGHEAEEAIAWAAEEQITVGVGGNRFGIGETLTRYQMVTFLLSGVRSHPMRRRDQRQRHVR